MRPTSWKPGWLPLLWLYRITIISGRTTASIERPRSPYIVIPPPQSSPEFAKAEAAHYVGRSTCAV